MRIGLALLLAPLLFAFLVTATQPSPEKPLAAAQVALQGSMNLQDALKLLSGTGNAAVDLRSRYGQEAPNPALEFALGKTTFWPAADEIAKKANLRLQPWMNSDSKECLLGFVGPSAFGNGAQLPPAYDGPFRVVIKRTNADRHFDDQSLSSLSITIELAWEPRYRPLLLKVGNGSVRATNADGSSVVVDQGGTTAIRLLGEAAVEIPVRLPLPPRQQLTLPKLECQFAIQVPPEQLLFTIPRLAQNEQQTHKGVTALVNHFDVEPKSGLWTIGITLKYPAGTLDLESHQTWAVEGNDIALVHRNGQRIASKLNRDVAIEDGGSIRVTYYFERMAGRPDEYHLEYQAPAAPLTYSAKFTFHNLPLP